MHLVRPFCLYKGLTYTMDPVTQEASRILEKLGNLEKVAQRLVRDIYNIKTEFSALISSSQKSSNVSSSKRTLEQPDSPDTKRSHVDFSVDSNGYVIAYTDGACENNGKSNARAGIGVWFNHNHPLNVSKPVQGRATNNTAEIQACIEALQVIKRTGNVDKVKILTDSQFTINCMTKWIFNWKKNSWKLSSGGPVKNKEDLEKLDAVRTEFQDIKWEYCAGHAGILGNEEADRLAREGATKYKSSANW